jgi:hypothetical protein
LVTPMGHLCLREERALRVKLGAAGAPGLMKPERREAVGTRQGALTRR